MKLGIDVGGTNTDAVILSTEGDLLGASKHLTTPDILTGIYIAVQKVLKVAEVSPKCIKGIFLGTTHGLNALQYSQGLARTALVRVCRSSSKVKPMVGWPRDLQQYVKMVTHISGGHDWDGSRFDSSQKSGEIEHIVHELIRHDIESVAVISTFSPIYQEEERWLKDTIQKALPNVHVTMSYHLSSIGFIERENTTLLNVMLSKVFQQAMVGLESMFRSLAFECPFWFIQNDGCLMSLEDAFQYPVLTLDSGVTNSMRGAAKLTGLKHCIVVDMGGSTTEIGRVTNGEPEYAITPSKVKKIKVSARLPRKVSLAMGGGSVIEGEGGESRIGSSIAHDIEHQALSWGGKTWTLTDAFLKIYPDSLNHKNIQKQRLQHLSDINCKQVIREFTDEIKEHIEHMQPNKENLPIVLVGGGSPLLMNHFISKYETYLHPLGYQYSNALGACYAPVSGQVDRVFWLGERKKEDIIEEITASIFQEVEEKGAKKESIQLATMEEFPFTYLKGEVIRLRMKAIGKLNL